MSTQDIGFYEFLTKIIFELSSNIIKYAPYFFCWKPLWLLCQYHFSNKIIILSYIDLLNVRIYRDVDNSICNR